MTGPRRLGVPPPPVLLVRYAPEMSGTHVGVGGEPPHSPIPWTVPGAFTTRSRAPLASRILPVDGPATTPGAVAILGLADDLGVRLNGGRAGAAAGPGAFREALSRYGVAEPDGFAWPEVRDAGDVVPAPGNTATALHETHGRVSEASAALVKLGYFPVGIGGGHDLTFPFVRGVINARREMTLAVPDSVVYVDPHLDVRPEAGSGMSFRSLVESCGVTRLVNIGYSPMVNAHEHSAWFRAHGGVTLGPLEAQRVGTVLVACTGKGALSFDLDAIDMAFAPGVSALNPIGLTPEQAVSIMDAMAPERWAACADFMELSPPNDPSGRTPRLLAHLFLALLRRLSERGA